MEFLVVMRIRDPKDPEVQRRRVELRPAHLSLEEIFFRVTGHSGNDPSAR